ncbi:MAG: Na-K-Cl cotransporter [Candidatus Eisenbacteria sp.]|nr:Na-K-Cl cotransporter [Candidatus Eisenbacteria bacterium]
MSSDTEQRGGLGTFLGVYTPTVLTILGVIMFLRTGWLLGHLGLPKLILVICLANAITIITTLSFSAVATNIRIGVAGAYFITSRSLGLAVGGAIGLPLFFSQALSVTLYSFGLAESLRIIWPALPLQPVALGVVLGVGLLVYLGAGAALKAQVPIMILIGVALAGLAIGALARGTGPGFALEPPSGELGLWRGFAVFFPAVTGIMAGLGLSGDLRDPGRAIPLGAFLAVGTGLIVYLGVPVLLAFGAPGAILREDPLVWTRIAPFGALLILPGLWGAIFSSAVGSMLGAPRTLQALSMDRLLPRRLRGRPGTPGQAQGRRALTPWLLISLAISLVAVFLGDLNAVAPVVTMFFLTVYGTINVVTALETLSKDPSWRPRLRVPWWVSLLGAIGCLFAMVLINPLAGLLAFVAEGVLWALLSRRQRELRWGDARRGIYEALVRWALVRHANRPMSARSWRPNVLVFVSDPVQHLDLIRFGDWFSQARGVVTVCELVVGDLLEEDLDLAARRRTMRKLFLQERLVVFPEVMVVSDIVEGITQVAQANGLGTMDSNAVLLGWPKDRGLMTEFLRVMRRLERVRRSLIIGRIQPSYSMPRSGAPRTVHVWWGGMQRNGDLMLLLAHLLTRNAAWHGSRVEVLSIASNDLARQQTETYLSRLMPEIRIEAQPRVIMKPKDRSVRDVIHAESAEADVVFFGLATPAAGEAESYAQRIEELAGDLPTVFFVKNSSLFVGDLLKSGGA